MYILIYIYFYDHYKSIRVSTEYAKKWVLCALAHIHMLVGSDSKIYFTLALMKLESLFIFCSWNFYASNWLAHDLVPPVMFLGRKGSLWTVWLLQIWHNSNALSPRKRVCTSARIFPSELLGQNIGCCQWCWLKPFWGVKIPGLDMLALSKHSAVMLNVGSSKTD